MESDASARIKGEPAEGAETKVAGPKDERPTLFGLPWYDDVVALAPGGGAKESWLTPSAGALQLLYQSLEDAASDPPSSTARGRHCFEVASLWFKLFKKHGVGLLVADSWLDKCEAALASNVEPSEGRQELQDDLEPLKAKIKKAVLENSVEKLQEPLVSGGVHAIIGRVRSLEGGDDWNRKAWSVLALRAVAELLDALSDVSNSPYTDKQVSAVFYAHQLGELFALVRNKPLQAWYSGESERLAKSMGSPTQEGGEVTSIMEIVEEAIKVSKSADEVFSKLSDKGDLTFSTYEQSYIQSRLVRHSLLHFEDEVDTLLKQTDWRATEALVEGRGRITLLEHIPAPFSGLKACQVLLANKERVPIKEELKCVSKFKIACISHQISLFGPSDVTFFNAVRTVLRTCVDVDAVSHALGLRTFYEERENACGKLVSRILGNSTHSPVPDEAMSSLRRAARDLEDHAHQWPIEDELKELVWSYIRPAQVRKAVLDGRQVVEVKCKKTALSKVLPEVRRLMENPRVEEVRFVVPDCLRLDADLGAGVWHGVNVWIQTAKLQVAGQVVLDVSGSNGTPAEYSRKAADGTTSGESGVAGNDGFAGESGGNVTIVADEIDHQERLTVVSRGGDGGKGQDGGDGVRGKDGFSHTYESLNTFLGENNIYYGLRDPIIKRIEEATATRIQWDRRSDYYHVKTRDGGEIIYSIAILGPVFNPFGYTDARNKSYFLHKGGPGMAGGGGGKPGRGGMGGYGGRVQINTKRTSRTQDAVNGSTGNAGKPGAGATSGKSGYDIAFTNTDLGHAKWYGEDRNAPKLLDVQFTEHQPPGNSIRFYYQNKYARIVESKRTVTYQQSVQENVKDTSKLQTQATANKKKTISTASMLNTYQEYAVSVEVTSVVRDNFEEMLRQETAELESLSAVSVQEKLRVNVHRESVVAEKTASPPGDSMEHGVTKIESVDVPTAEAYVADMEANPNVSEKWMKLKYFLPSPEQFQRLFKSQETTSSCTDSKRLLLDKYRTTSLQEIAKHGENSFGLFSRQQRCGPIEKYVFGDKEPKLEYDSSTKKSVRQHFEKLQTLNDQQGDANGTIRRAIKYFADDVKEQLNNEVMKDYIAECAALEAAKAAAWRRYLDVLEENPLAYDLWVRAYNGERVDDELRAAIATDQAVQTALVAFSAAPVYDWKAAAKDDKVLKEVSLFLAASGSLSSGCFREVLADASNQHVRVFTRDDDDGEAAFKLSAEHGEKHSSKLFVHQTSSGKFRQLKFNREYFNMECKARFKSDVFAFVLERMNALKTKEDIDSFARELVPLDEAGALKTKEDIDSFARELVPLDEARVFVFEDFVLSHTSKVESCDEQHESGFDADVESVVEHFPSSLRSFLSGKLELLHPRYAHNGIVASLARRLAVEQLQVSSDVAHWLVDMAVEAAASGSETLGLCQFIAAANRQEDWAAELLLIQLDNHLRMEIPNKDGLRARLENISDQVKLLLSNKLNDDTFSGKLYLVTEDKIVDLISRLVECGDDVVSKLREVSVGEWVYVLEEAAWRTKLEPLTAWNEEQLQGAVHYLSTLAWKRGQAVVRVILNEISEKKHSELSASALLELLAYLKSDECQLPTEQLPAFVRTLPFVDWNNNGRKMLLRAEEQRKLSDLTAIISNNANTSQNFMKGLEMINAVYKDVETLSIAGAKEAAKELNALLALSKDASVVDASALKKYVALVGAIDTEIQKVMGFKLRDTQKLSALLLLANKSNSLIQVATGEGKTMIVLVVAIIKVLCGHKVHIVTSSSVLAKRDATSEKNVEIYQAFGVNVSHNCSENAEERRSAYSTNQVIYGDLSNFQRDHLLVSFYQKDIMGDHTRKEVMIIDEVDSMLLDKGNNMLYLSHDIGDLDKLDSVFAFIWQRINDLSQDVTTRFDVDLIRSKILSDLYSSITREDLRLLDKSLSLVQVEELWDRLRDAGIIDLKGVLKSEDGWNEESLRDACRLPERGGDHTVLTGRVRFLLTQIRDREKAIEAPNFLKPFVTLHVDEWIRNAIQALSMEENQDYVVDVDRAAASADVFPIVTILDKDTGTDQANSQWDGGLHQFLQIKHGCKLSALSLKAVFISNVTYFKQYENIYGMTGTLGTSKEKEMLQRVHGVDFLTMPTFMPKKFVELPPVVCAGRRQWVAGVVEETRDLLDAKGRGVLVICETIDEVRTLAAAFREAGRANVHTYTRDYEAFELPGGKLEPGHVVLATNLAGRGTDIKLTAALLKAGGLHVVLTYLPRSGRVERQAFGRAARKGEPGTGRLVVCVPDEAGTSALRVADMRARRDAKDHDATEEFYKSQILGEEACMLHFEGLYKKLKDTLSKANYPTDLKHILLEFYVNKWALWLDRNESIIKTMNKGMRKKSLDSGLSLHAHVSKSYDPKAALSLLDVVDQPSTMVKIGKYFRDVNAETSIDFFDAVVGREPHFSESALYYKCAARVKLMHETDGSAKRKENAEVIRKDLRLAARAIDRRKASVMQTARIIANTRKERVRVTDKDAFQVQADNLVLVYETFEKSIVEMCGAPTSTFELGGGDEELGERVEKKNPSTPQGRRSKQNTAEGSGET